MADFQTILSLFACGLLGSFGVGCKDCPKDTAQQNPAATATAQLEPEPEVQEVRSVLEFKGLIAGQPVTPAQVESALSGEDGAVECRDGGADRHICNGPTSVAGVRATTNTVITETSRIMRISLRFSEDDFDAVLEAAKSKYGDPSDTRTETLQNRLGAKFENSVYHWQGDRETGAYLILTRYSGSIENSSMYFGTQEDTDFLRKVRAPDTSDM